MQAIDINSEENKITFIHGLFIRIEHPQHFSLDNIREYVVEFEDKVMVQKVMLSSNTREKLMKHFEPVDGEDEINAFLSEFEDIEKDPD